MSKFKTEVLEQTLEVLLNSNQSERTLILLTLFYMIPQASKKFGQGLTKNFFFETPCLQSNVYMTA